MLSLTMHLVLCNEDIIAAFTWLSEAESWASQHQIQTPNMAFRVITRVVHFPEEN